MTNDEVFEKVRSRLNFKPNRAQRDYLRGIIELPGSVYTRQRCARRAAIIRAYYAAIKELAR